MNLKDLSRKALSTLVLSMLSLVALAQGQTITGVVTDDFGDPMIGVNVSVKGTTNGAVTDFDGNYSLTNVKSTDVLVFTFIGYTTKEVTVGTQKKIDMQMFEDQQALEEVVVVGYGTMKKSDLTGSVSSVSTESLVQKGASSVMEALQGSVPGVSITKSSGRVGGGFDVEIRGKSSINSSTKPIYVVDGIICDDIDFLNEQDIERIDVLKDASSTAIYGSRATAGVIIVTTKSGKAVGQKMSNKPTVSYDGYYGITKIARMPDFMGTQDFYNYRFLRFLEYGEGSAVTAQSGQPNYMLGNYGQMALCVEQAGPTDAEHSVLRQMLAAGQSFDWTKALTQTGTQQNHYISISGGADKVNYHMGVGYTGDKGVYRGDEQRRLSLKGSVDAKINDWVSAGFTFNLAYTRNQYAYDNAVADAFGLNAFALPYDKDGNMIFAPGAKNALGTDGNQFSDAVNPLYKAKSSTYDKNRKTYRMLGNFYLQITPMKGLVFKSNFQPSYTNYREAEFYDPTEMRDLGARDSDLHSGWTNIKAYYQTNVGMSYIWDNMITWDKTFASKHQVNVMGLASFTQNNSENKKDIYTDVLPSTKWWNLKTGTYDADNSSNSYGEGSMLSYALRANYTYAGKYMLTATVRWDGSSKFADGHRWGSFPSAALAWRLSEEDFMKGIDWLDNLKLRLSYGMTGNNKGVGNYATQQTLNGPSYYPFGGTYMAGYYSSSPVNKALSWETSKEYNVGVDFAFLNSRVNGTIDVYQKKTQDLLYSVTLPLVTGGVKMTTNVGSVKNSGIELSLNTVNIVTKDWRWETTFNFARNNNEVLEINGEGTDIVPSGATGGLFIGHNVNAIYGFNWQGIVSDREMTVPDNNIARAKGLTPGTKMRECDYYYTCYGLVEGNPMIEDVNGDGAWDNNDKKIMDADPSWTGSFSTSLAYKNWDLNASLYAKVNYKVYSNFYGSGYYKYSDRGTQHMCMDFYIPQGTLIDCDGVNPDGTYINPKYQERTHYGKYPFPTNAGNTGLGTASSAFEASRAITDLSYLKIKNISLGYTLPKKYAEKAGLANLRLYCTVTNPFVFTDYKGYDPEWASASTSKDGPSTITWEFGANIKF